MQIQPYDILLYKGDSFIGNIIKFVTRSDYFHVSLAIDDIHVVEALPDGIDIMHLRDSKFGYDIYRFAEILTDNQKEKLHEFIYLKLATPYNYEEIFAELLHEELGLHIPVTSGKLICSEFVFACYLYCGINLLPDLEEGEIITPKSIAESKLLVKVSD